MKRYEYRVMVANHPRYGDEPTEWSRTEDWDNARVTAQSLREQYPPNVRQVEAWVERRLLPDWERVPAGAYLAESSNA